MKMKNRYRRHHCPERERIYSRVFVDENGQEYHVIEKQLPGLRKPLCSTYIIKKKRKGKELFLDIALQWLVRLVVNLLPVGDWFPLE